MHHMAKQLKKLSTVDQVIDAFGGPTGMADWTGIIGPSAVCNWQDRGFIPAGWHFRLDRDARARGFEIASDVFNYRLKRKEQPPADTANDRAA